MIGCASENTSTIQEPILDEVMETGQPAEQPLEAPKEPALPEEVSDQDIPVELLTNKSSQEPEEVPTGEPALQQPIQPSSARCKDSDVTIEHPDGINFDVVGNITINGKPVIRGTDYCANVVTISEWYCMGDISRVKTVKCPGQCQKGVCV